MTRFYVLSGGLFFVFLIKFILSKSRELYHDLELDGSEITRWLTY